MSLPIISKCHVHMSQYNISFLISVCKRFNCQLTLNPLKKELVNFVRLDFSLWKILEINSTTVSYCWWNILWHFSGHPRIRGFLHRCFDVRRKEVNIVRYDQFIYCIFYFIMLGFSFMFIIYSYELLTNDIHSILCFFCFT